MSSQEWASWVSAGATFAAVAAALGIAWLDRRAASRERTEARREAHQRWELDQLVRVAFLTTHSGVAHDAPPEVKAQETTRHAERLALRWILGGADRFPIGIHAGEKDVETLEDLRRVAADDGRPWFVRAQAEAVLEAAQAADRYKGPTT